MALSVYVAVYVVDTVLLYSYSAFGMPVSTTACLVFELLGASFALGALLLALATNTVWHWRPRGVRVALRGYWRGKSFAGAALVAVGLSALLYSGFLTSASGPLDSLRTFATYFERAGGHGLHDHPWWYNERRN